MSQAQECRQIEILNFPTNSLSPILHPAFLLPLYKSGKSSGWSWLLRDKIKQSLREFDISVLISTFCPFGLSYIAVRKENGVYSNIEFSGENLWRQKAVFLLLSSVMNA